MNTKTAAIALAAVLLVGCQPPRASARLEGGYVYDASGCAFSVTGSKGTRVRLHRAPEQDQNSCDADRYRGEQ